MLILVMLWEHERPIWDASRYTLKPFAALHAFMYSDASHLGHPCSHNMIKINIQNLLLPTIIESVNAPNIAETVDYIRTGKVIINSVQTVVK